MTMPLAYAQPRTEPSGLSLKIPFLQDDRPVPRSLLFVTALLTAVAYLSLCTSYFYPLVDSSLYMVLARSVANGEGVKFLGNKPRCGPLTPLVLGAVIKAGGGMLAIHIVLSLFTLLSHVLAFLTVRRWFNERLAILAVLATAAQYWVFRLGILVMTEPIFMAAAWGGLLALSHLPRSGPFKRWALVFGSCMLMGLAFSSRPLPMLLLVPGALIAIWMENRRETSWLERCGWVAIFLVVFGLLLWRFGKGALSDNDDRDMASVPVGMAHLSPTTPSLTERYQIKFFRDLKGSTASKLEQMPVIGGRWINETFAAGTSYFFQSKNTLRLTVGRVLSLMALLFVIVGWVEMLRRRSWWLAGLSLYAVPFWLLWAGRIMPRYLSIIGPLLFILLCVGMVRTVHSCMWRSPRAPAVAGALARIVPTVLVILIVLANVWPYYVEFHVRKQTSRDFYDIARRGAYADLVDIGAFLRKHARKGETVWINTILTQRNLVWVSGLRCEPVPGFQMKKLDDTAKIPEFLSKVPGRFAVVHTMNKRAWPSWHWPIRRTDQPAPHFWFLYVRDPRTGVFHHVIPPKDRDYVRGIPAANIGPKPEFPATQPTSQPTTAPSTRAILPG